MKKFLNMLFSRVVIISLSIAIQAAFLVLLIWRFNNYYVYVHAACVLLSLVVTLGIIGGRSNPGYKIAWLVPILLFPIFGGLFYLMFGRNQLSARERKKMAEIQRHTESVVDLSGQMSDELYQIDADAGSISRYIARNALSPLYQNTAATYFPIGEAKFARLLEELQKAQHFIFMEYFIIQEGKMWDPILEILIQKAKQGVEVRVIYDDVGCIDTLPYHYDRELEKLGIACCAFNPFVPVLSARLNNRDHRKIVVIDGHTGFTGGINLADEYINAYPKHGHWKDAAIMLKGDAVWSLTVMFLSMWNYLRHTDEDYTRYRSTGTTGHQLAAPGYLQPFSDSPLDHEAVGETVYMQLISRAKKYVYINTPYLIIDNEMVTALTTAAKSGVDVRIITPHVADKWYVHAVTRAYYKILVESGVKIFEYTPGFVHAKTFVVDDIYGVVGTINLDYRSLYLHFECGVWMYKTPCLTDMKRDFLETQQKCQSITLQQCQKVSLPTRICRALLRVFAPLM